MNEWWYIERVGRVVREGEIVCSCLFVVCSSSSGSGSSCCVIISYSIIISRSVSLSLSLIFFPLFYLSLCELLAHLINLHVHQASLPPTSGRCHRRLPLADISRLLRNM